MRGSAKCNLGFHAVQASNERFKGQMPFKDTKKLQDASTAQRRNPKSPRNAAAHAPPFPGCWHLHGRGNTTGRISAHSPFSPLEPRKTRRACDACREPRAWKRPRVARQLPGRVPCIFRGGWVVCGWRRRDRFDLDLDETCKPQVGRGVVLWRSSVAFLRTSYYLRVDFGIFPKYRLDQVLEWRSR